MEALYDAADDDSATGGPDLARKIYPSIVTITGAEGAVHLSDERGRRGGRGRRDRPGQPAARLTAHSPIHDSHDRGATAVTMPLYASPEQLMRDRSEYARKGIARGRSVVALKYSGGVLFVAENPSTTLHKVSEIYDRIGFAAAGRYSEYESLRRGGIRHVDLWGYANDPRDVSARQLANVYAQTLGVDLHRPAQAVRGGDLRGRGRRRRPRTTSSTG